jgi:predicted DCC family thiol-disulfide oxidoreductase YuxK
VVLFDGECQFCNRSVQFILRRDPAGYFRFAPKQSPVAERLLRKAGQEREQMPESIVLLEGDRVFLRSTAALRIARRLNGFWPLLSLFLIVPAFLRDAVYNGIARNRYRFMGKRESCMLPSPEIRERFLSE